MLKSNSTKVISVLFIAVLVQVVLFLSMSMINTALANGGGSDDDSGSDSDDSYNNFSQTVINLESKLQITDGKIFPSGNIGLTASDKAYSPFGESGGTAFYRNPDGTYNTITYPPTGSGSSSDGSSGTSSCPAGYIETRAGCVPDIPPPPIATISQSQATTLTGESFNISYGSSGGGTATSCTLQRQSATVTSNGGGVSNFGDNIGTPGTYTYSTQCYGPGGSSSWVSLDHIVNVPPPTVSLSADLYLVPFNTATTLRWSSQNTNSCTASGVWSGSRATAGGESTGNLKVPSTYFLQCHNSYGHSTSPAAVTINIQYGTGSEIKVTPTVTRKNNPVTVTWDTGTSDPANCQIETGSVVIRSPLTSKTGSLTHTIAGETTFTINCEDNHNTDDATVKVLPEYQET